jgi:hypothetical protein
VPRLVLQGTTHDTVRAEIGYGEKVSRRLWSRKLEEIGLMASHKDTGRPEGCRVFELERVVSCRNADPWWGSRLDFDSRQPTFIGPPHLGQRQRPSASSVGATCCPACGSWAEQPNHLRPGAGSVGMSIDNS